MRKLIGFIFLVLLVVSCQPAETSKKTTCSNGEVFDEVKRICIVDDVPKIPVLSTSSVTMNENTGENTFAISYTDIDGDDAQTCSVTSTFNSGMRAVLRSGGVAYKAKTNNPDAHTFSLELRPDGIGGSETVSVSGCTGASPNIGFCDIVVHMENGISTSSSIKAAIDADGIVSGYLDVAVESLQLQTDFPATNFQGASCSCTNGNCSFVTEPTDDFTGVVTFDYFISDNDGDSATRSLFATVNNVDQAPVSTDIIWATAGSEETAYSITIANTTDYTDGDGDLATSCLIFNLDSNLSSMGCSCTGGNCTATVIGATDYFNTVSFRLFDYMVYAGGAYSNASSAYGTINNVNDAPTITSSALSFTFNEDVSDQFGGTTTVTYGTFDLVGGADIESDPLIYLVDGASFSGPGTLANCLLSADDVAGCEIQSVDKDFSGDITFQYKANDGAADSNLIDVTVTIVAQNDPPFHNPSNAPSVSFSGAGFEESPTFYPATYTITLPSGQDEEDGTGTAALSYVLWDNVGSAVQASGSVANGTLSDCMNLPGSDGGDDLTCTYVPNDGNINGLLETLHYKVMDSAGSFSAAAREFTITLGATSDVPTACQYSRYDRQAGRTECGISGCRADGSPQGAITPSSHTDDNPLVYFDQAAGVCYSSINTTTWSTCQYTRYDDANECGASGCIGSGDPSGVITPSSHSDENPVVYYDQSADECWTSESSSTWIKGSGSASVDKNRIFSFLRTVTVAEKETVLIDNIIINEGGDSSEDGEGLSIDPASIEITSSVADLIKKENITFKSVGGGSSYEFKGDVGSVQAIAVPADVADDMRFSIEIVPTHSTVGEALVSFEISDDAGTPNVSKVQVKVIVKPYEVQHKGWNKVKAVGIKTARNTPIEMNTSCPFSSDKCVESTTSQSGTVTVAAGATALSGSTTSFTSLSVGDYISIGGEINQVAAITDDSNLTLAIAQNTAQTNVSYAKVLLGACLSTSGSAPTVDAAIGAIFRNGAGQCYYRTASATWTNFSPYCDITEVKSQDAKSIGIVDGTTDVDSTNECDTVLDSASCLGNGTPATVGLDPSNNDGVFYYNYNISATADQKCWVSRNGAWTSYSSSTEVTLGWENFNVLAGAIAGYNVYRKVAGGEFDYEAPVNRDLIDLNATEYLDNGTNSVHPPVPNTVYFYEVRPVIDAGGVNLESTSNESIAKIRVMSPPDNMVFAHRWMLNKNVCEKMGRTPEIDFNYACEYDGLGDITASAELQAAFPTGSTFTTAYDVSNDYLINRYELGCPFNKGVCTPDGAVIVSGVNSVPDNSCVTNDPTIDAAALTGITYNLGDFFYNRATGKCYANDGAGTWTQADTETLVNTDGVDAFSAYLPPLVNFPVEDASSICTSQSTLVPNAIVGVNGAAAGEPTNDFTLPTRYQQVAYSQWEKTLTQTDVEIDFLEEGLALNAASKCNSSDASGFESNYSDSGLPGSLTAYTIPGTDSSGIRSLYTGSYETRACESIFGVQDMVGNVAEVTTNTFDYVHADFRMTASNFNTVHRTTGAGASASATGLTAYANDEETGGCVDLIGPTTIEGCEEDGTTMLDEYVLDLTSNVSGILIPLGLPISDDYMAGTPSESVNLLGVTPYTQVGEFHNDRIDYNQRDFVANAADTTGHMVVSGSYDNANGPNSVIGYDNAKGAGVYSFEVVRETTERQDIGLRCIITIPATDYTESHAND